MRLVADRFVTHDADNPAFAMDLATGGTVWLEARATGDADEQRRWSVRCDELFQLRHPHVATLVDYGPLGSDRRFEAWSGRAWTGRPEHAAQTVRAAAAFFHALGLAAHIGDMLPLTGVHGPVARPGRYDGEPQRPEPPVRTGCDVPGIQLVSRSSIAAIAEMLSLENDRSPRAAALWGAAGSGLDTATLLLARNARMRGYVPVRADALDARTIAVLAGRSLFIIARGPEAAATARSRQPSGGRAFLNAAIRSPRPHVLLLVQREEVRGLDGVEIGRVDREALLAAVKAASETAARAARRAADSARGMPGAFARILWQRPGRSQAVAAAGRSRVAEPIAVYDGAATPAPSDPAAAPGNVPAASWPAPGELSALRRRLGQGEQLLAAGRHAPGLRLVRQVVGALARRQAWADAAGGGLALARALLARGRARDAMRVLDEAREHAGRGEADRLLSEVALLTGIAWIDLARLDDAECVLRAGAAAVRTVSDRAQAHQFAYGLSRCLFWRADYAGAAAVLAALDPDPGLESAELTHLRHTARLAAVDGDASRALAAADAGVRIAQQGTPAGQADAYCTSALVRLVVGDLAGVDRPVERCAAAARAARRPMRAFAALIVQAEADRRRRVALSAQRRRTLERMARTATPLLRLRFELVRSLVEARDEAAAAAALATASGIPALTAFVPASRGSGPLRGDLDPLVRELVEIVHVCHDADEEQTVLRQVCVRVRQQLRAAAVAFVAGDGVRDGLLVSDGSRLDGEIAGRVMASGVTAGPCRVGDRLEAAAPVRYGGSPIAALCARWAPGAADELARAAAVLTVAATAAAPIVHAIKVRRQAPAAGVPELIGATPAVAELRRAVERAAAAPFPVLVEGESGSGKELVARGIHRAGPRRDRPFCTLNCAALPDDLVESELFGHARGAFTGATTDRPGVFEEAHGGTIFLDEVGELSLRAQAKVLRVIQEGELRRIGENISRRVDARIVCATNRDLRGEAEAGRFRRDLLYRLDVIRIVVPPLRERREDVAALLDHFWADATRRIGSRATLSAAARALLGGYDWPGNVRELQNVLAALAVRSPQRGVVPPHALPPHIAAAKRPDAWRLDAARRTFEEAFVRAALVRAGGQRIRAAEELGLTRQGLNKLMTRLGIE